MDTSSGINNNQCLHVSLDKLFCISCVRSGVEKRHSQNSHNESTKNNLLMINEKLAEKSSRSVPRQALANSFIYAHVFQ